MSQIADIVILNNKGQLTLIVEVKYILGKDSLWAARMRRNMYAHGVLPFSPFFLLAFPDQFYLWSEEEDDNDAFDIHRVPSSTINPAPFLEPYYETIGLGRDELSEASFEVIVTSWLNDIIHADDLSFLPPNGEHWLRHSGLYKAICGGSLRQQVAL